MRKLRNTLLGATAVTLLAVSMPTAAWAYSPLSDNFRLQHYREDIDEFVTGTGVRTIKNSSGQKIGEYEMWIQYDIIRIDERTSRYTVYVDIRVKDTLLGNGRGVVVKVMTKTGSSTSNVVAGSPFKGGSGSWISWSDKSPANTSAPVWAVDVDHGEDWAGNPFVYTGNYDRYVNQYETTKENWPFFNYYPNPGA